MKRAFSLKKNTLLLSRQIRRDRSEFGTEGLHPTYKSTDFVAHVFGLDVVPHSSRCVQPPRDGIFVCHRRRIESNFTRETFDQCIDQILLHSKYERTNFEELALDIGFHLVDQTDAGKLAREIGLATTGDNGLVPNQQKRRVDALAL
jgi:hypothetical protein